jgi:hypothetical protein
MTTLTPAQIAAELHLATETVVAYLKTGRIAGGFQIVPGGVWRVEEDAFRTWLRERSAPVDANRIEPRSERAKAARTRSPR